MFDLYPKFDKAEKILVESPQFKNEKVAYEMRNGYSQPRMFTLDQLKDLFTIYYNRSEGCSRLLNTETHIQ